eukprot:gene52177-45312_t
MGGPPGGPEKMPEQEIERALDEWLGAKKSRDYATADRIRAMLRTQGEVAQVKDIAGFFQRENVDQNAQNKMLELSLQQVAMVMARGELSSANNPMAALMARNMDTEELLFTWNCEKKMKNFKLCDAIRVRLRARGISPGTAGPGRPPVKTVDDATEQLIQEFRIAKMSNNFAGIALANWDKSTWKKQDWVCPIEAGGCGTVNFAKRESRNECIGMKGGQKCSMKRPSAAGLGGIAGVAMSLYGNAGSA